MAEAQDFRGVVEHTESEPLDIGDPTNIKIHGKEATPISLWEKLERAPYLVDYYQINDIAEKMGLVDKAKFISDFVIEEMQNLKYTDTKESFKEIFSELEKNMPENLQPQEKIRRLEQLIKIIQKERDLKEKKQWLLTEQKKTLPTINQ